MLDKEIFLQIPWLCLMQVPIPLPVTFDGHVMFCCPTPQPRLGHKQTTPHPFLTLSPHLPALQMTSCMHSMCSIKHFSLGAGYGFSQLFIAFMCHMEAPLAAGSNAPLTSPQNDHPHQGTLN